ncbi:hypothetical protein [Actinoplanes sp. HUAS TT8]|uniref:hypothetical protein n=1 Tax=Actinoplanes sp. HUAS TT8 TaxID=3447453 RepID=UPI003F520295
MPDDVLRVVGALHDEFRQAAFPRRLVVDDVAGVEMVTLASGVDGCVSAWLEHEGHIDDRRWNHLAECEQRLIRVMPALKGAEATYYQRLLDMTALILEIDA